MERDLSSGENWYKGTQSFSTKFKKSIPIYMLLLPAMMLLLVFHYAPIFGIVIAFKNFSPFKGIIGSNWAGLKYFISFLTDENFWRVMRNTILINFYQLVFGFPFPIIFAIFLNELKSDKFKKVVQTVSYLPHFVSWVVVASIVTTVLSPSSGIINSFLKSVLNIEPIYFLVKQQYFRSILVVSSIWKGFGMSSVYYIASLASIDQELYQAAAIDGAARIRQTWHITLPGLRNIIIVLLVINIGSIITIGFEQIYLLYNPLVYDVGDVISTYTYRLGIEKVQYSLTSAIGITQSAVNFILVYTANRLSRVIAGWSLW
ncbi:MAG TPA: ABC transporter permease subunit [Clostridiales bacterium]|nr:ABC transporter permease subunit [Clostridiales bacterium]